MLDSMLDSILDSRFYARSNTKAHETKLSLGSFFVFCGTAYRTRRYVEDVGVKVALMVAQLHGPFLECGNFPKHPTVVSGV